MYVSKYTTKLVLNSWLSFDWNTYDYVHISSTIEIYSGVLRSTLWRGEGAFFYSGEPEWRKHKNWGLSTTLQKILSYMIIAFQVVYRSVNPPVSALEGVWEYSIKKSNLNF